MMELLRGVFGIEPFPAVLLKDVRTVVIADMHIGFESAMANMGLFVPKVQLSQELEALRQVGKLTSAERLLIAGDVKHEFGEFNTTGFRELLNALESMRRLFSKLVVVRGNHDTYLPKFTGKVDIELLEEFAEGRYLVAHGDVEVSSPRTEGEVVIIGHEHPVVVLYDEVGGKERIPCFLVGRLYDGRDIIVLPAFSTLVSGSEVNVIPKEELLSPVLRESADVDEMDVIGVTEFGYMRLPKLGVLRASARA
jgi:putative SbcD/Mre11-related phosphoesterase